MQAEGTRLDDPQALLVSNNPYATGQVLEAGRRSRLDGGGGVLGLLAVHVAGAAQAADFALRGERSDAVTVLTPHEVTQFSTAAVSRAVRAAGSRCGVGVAEGR